MQQMNVIYFIFLCLLLSLTKSGANEDQVTVTKVPAGHIAELPCLSSDDHHRFMFWHLTGNNRIIGPGNLMDENKYNYEVLTGKLFIRSVSTAESGFYKCFSKGISDRSNITSNTIELIVKKDWEDLWENDFETNLLRGMAAVMVIVVAIAIVLFIITTKRRHNRNFFDLEESRENSPAKYTPNIYTVPPPSMSIPTIDEGGIDNEALDIDFPRVFNQMQK
ncbi:uncharacterized protein LOC126915516 isoform X1 [Bombus affinis]|uniref:Uncharacterized protein LOC100649730 isoform X1 n=2 Tax=Bombus terrestris TaxID=30195 RepID=A0A9B2JMY6_BOMTE|nr:uncharacterized protein LOC100649730 isoform X1 [Bombus terrestris]XP_050576217.1 uncharacterized protein LOC126915516 isoform X1 [Bombus affinis]